MSITLRFDKNRQRSLGVLGQLDTAAEQGELLAELALSADGDSLELDFYDADKLSPLLIAALAQCMDRGTRLKIVAYRSQLGHSLLRLGFPTQQVGTKQEYSSLTDCSVLTLAGSEAAGAFRQVLRQSAITSVAAAAMSGGRAEPSGELLEMFLQAIWEQYSHDLRGYQRASLGRRLKVLMSQCGLPGFSDFQLALFSDRSLFDRIAAEISVGITSFFRHPQQFHALRTDVLPYLASFPVLKLWSAGCSTGEEAYSLAILLEELGLLEKSRLFATDSNSYLLDLAQSGLYPLDVLEESCANYLQSGGAKSFDAYVEKGKRYLTMPEKMRQNTIFFHHSLVGSGVFNEFQLIVCRNVLIYFDNNLQNKILDCFVRSLHRDGFLVLGPRDGLAIPARRHGLVPLETEGNIYRLREGTAYAG